MDTFSWPFKFQHYLTSYENRVVDLNSIKDGGSPRGFISWMRLPSHLPSSYMWRGMSCDGAMSPVMWQQSDGFFSSSCLAPYITVRRVCWLDMPPERNVHQTEKPWRWIQYQLALDRIQLDALVSIRFAWTNGFVRHDYRNFWECRVLNHQMKIAKRIYVVGQLKLPLALWGCRVLFSSHFSWWGVHELPEELLGCERI